jgi:hypothetical protein
MCVCVRACDVCMCVCVCVCVCQQVSVTEFVGKRYKDLRFAHLNTCLLGERVKCKQRKQDK